MSYNSRKLRRDQEYVEEVELLLDACKYCYGDYVEHDTLDYDTPSSISAGSVGGTVPLGSLTDPLWMSVWGSTGLKYGLTSFGEAISFTVNSVSSITLVARGLFGTTAHAIHRYTKITLKHEGELDGTCRGFPDACSSDDSYDEDSRLSMKWLTSPVTGRLAFAGLSHKACKHDAGEVDIGESIGTPARFRVTLKDQIHNDLGIVPYPDRRSSRGTMFGKLLARHPYFQNRTIIYREGFRDHGTFGMPEYIERRFIIDDVELNDNLLTITALDTLILTEDKKAKMPVTSPATLSADISDSATTLSYSNAPSYYFGVMSTSVFVRVDSEVIQCTVSGAASLAVVARGYKSEAKAHQAGSSVQDCVRFYDTHIVDAIVLALSNYTSTPISAIDNYTPTIALTPTAVLQEAFLTKPTPVFEFINAMIKIGNLVYYFNQVTQKIVIKYIPELQAEPILLDGHLHLERGSIKVDQNIKNQFTRATHLFGPVDITKDSEENYAVRFMSVNLALESPEKLGEVNEKKAFNNPYLTNSSSDTLIATSYIDRLLSQTDEPPKIITAKVKSDFVGGADDGTLELGSVVSILTADSQNIDGDVKTELFQVLKITGNAFEDFIVKMRKFQALQPSEIDFTISTGGENYNLASHFAPASGTYTIYIDPGVVFYSNTITLPAFTTGSQAAGVEFLIINRGRMLGAGGYGGDAGIWTTPTTQVAPTSGSVGGTAFEATVPCIIDNGSGLIWAGGSGGSGEVQPIVYHGYGYTSYHWPAVKGGNGGQGYQTSLGGFSSTSGFGSSGSVVSNTLPEVGPRESSGGQSGPGTSGNGGGVWGQGGIAVKKNGHAVTFSSGDNTANVKGSKV